MPKNQEKPESQAWAHWEYTPDEWTLLDRMDWGSVVQRYVLSLVGGILGFFLLLALWLWSLTTAAANVTGFLLPVMVVLLILLLYIVVPGTAFHKARKRHQARKNPSHPHKVTLARKGIWEASAFFPLSGLGVEALEMDVKLREVWQTTQPTTLHFRVEYLRVGGVTSNNAQRAPRWVKETIHLLVPRANEHEAEHVAQRFRTEVVQARELAEKRAHDSIVNPPEPS